MSLERTCTLERALQTRNTHSDVKLMLRAPASLLLCGEYFVTQTSGQGLCLAVEPSAICTITWHGKKVDRRFDEYTQDAAQLITRFAYQEYVFENAYENEMYMLCDKCKDPYVSMYQRYVMPKAQRISVSVETNAFYTAYTNKQDVQKRGLGSSESAALLMCASLALCNGKDPLTNRRALASHASHAHYLWQGRRGSGYGTWTSAFGGMGIYTNYAEKNKDANADTSAPTPFLQNLWNALPREVFSSFCWWFWNCEFAQSSKDALLRYQTWKREKPHEEQKFFAQYRQLFRALTRDVLNSKEDGKYTAFLLQAMEQAKALGLSLGAQINVSADVKKFKDAENIHMMHTYKAVGAGCECAVGISCDNEQNDDDFNDIQSLTIAEGINYVVPRKFF